MWHKGPRGPSFWKAAEIELVSRDGQVQIPPLGEEVPAPLLHTLNFSVQWLQLGWVPLTKCPESSHVNTTYL